ncbi:ring-1,2-phenylacetyl-CoA epoxidase subunit PaaC [Aneurinibacillus soli]|uniref:1,2-phenylacetyl-CoA epoxidase, subunit C n=1 Tax=Aneurinibacillus soli TaxID=1500254 RepID=A0A0U5ASS1_9BACL|nr:1,2-phenylacetyl-CoA epoxidase subunit PaaC [Aneurinibacillus soli]PYE60961.1 ring-1,2-phenylacetyl-CoA epoxidase subunit PaaC [Aneurinibacillus soli]BAU26865.1 1,2-phenylacetyl-CoA epoxidase, subunit C [Aneurinibacillus soli]
MTKQYNTPEEAKQDQQFCGALVELMYQLADDDLIISHRGSEWLGLCPHIEEDVAFSSITQDTMGHAAMYYQMLEELGIGKADDLAHLRQTEEYKNAVLTERVNGEGDYMENPDYDWGYAIARNYTYEMFKKIRLDSLEASSYTPLADAAKKIKREQFYHLYHWGVWLSQLSDSTVEAQTRLNAAFAKTWEDVDSLFDLGPKADALVQAGLVPSGDELRTTFLNTMKEKLAGYNLVWPGEPAPVGESGRDGLHSEAFVDAITQLSEVYKLAPQANW